MLFFTNAQLGAELEDQGGDGTALTHWEKRIFQNEAMTGTVHTQNPVYSRLTFALLEDSGWYLPNYDLAQEITWGKNLGCEFATKSCKELMELDATNIDIELDKDNDDDLDMMAGEGKSMVPKKKYPFCNTLMASSPRTFCTSDGQSVGSCNLVTFGSPIPYQYQNFDAIDGVEERDITKVGSSVTLADFCPYIQEFTWKSSGDSEERGTRCGEVDNLPTGDSNYALEDYGKGSKCFLQGSKWNQKSCRYVSQSSKSN